MKIKEIKSLFTKKKEIERLKAENASLSLEKKRLEGDLALATGRAIGLQETLSSLIRSQEEELERAKLEGIFEKLKAEPEIVNRLTDEEKGLLKKRKKLSLDL